MNAMLIHADSAFLEMTADALLMQGVACDTFTSGLAALESLHGHPDGYRVVMADYTLPDMDGFRFALRVRFIEPGLRVVVMSGNMMSEYQRDIIRTKGMHVLCRPLTMDMLFMILGKARCGCMAERDSRQL